MSACVCSQPKTKEPTNDDLEHHPPRPPDGQAHRQARFAEDRRELQRDQPRPRRPRQLRLRRQAADRLQLQDPSVSRRPRHGHPRADEEGRLRVGEPHKGRGPKIPSQCLKFRLGS